METKVWYLSKELWFNILSAATAFLGSINGAIPAEQMPYIILAIGIINLILRLFFTKTGLTLTSEPVE